MVIKEAVINNLMEYLQEVKATPMCLVGCQTRYREGTEGKTPPYKWQVIDTGKDIIEKFSSLEDKCS
jgi:hypothetical protein